MPNAECALLPEQATPCPTRPAGLNFEKTGSYTAARLSAAVTRVSWALLGIAGAVIKSSTNVSTPCGGNSCTAGYHIYAACQIELVPISKNKCGALACAAFFPLPLRPPHPSVQEETCPSSGLCRFGVSQVARLRCNRPQLAFKKKMIEIKNGGAARVSPRRGEGVVKRSTTEHLCPWMDCHPHTRGVCCSRVS